MKLILFSAALLPLCLSSCDKKETAAAPAPATGATAATPAAAASNGTEAEAKSLVEAFTKEGADTKALTAALKPEKKDYEAVFSAALAPKVEAAHAPVWASNPAIGPKPGQTVARIVAKVTTAEIKEWNKNASDNLPGGYQKIKDDFKDGLTVYKFDFVEPGQDAGMSFDLLVHVNGHWRFFPKPWRAAQ